MRLYRKVSLEIILAMVVISLVSVRSASPQGPLLDADLLVEGAKIGNLNAVEAALAAGVDVNARNTHGETALAAAAGAHQEREDIVQLLLAQGARVDERSFGSSAVRVDVQVELSSYPQTFLACGTAVVSMELEYSNSDKIGVTALLCAAGAGHPKIVQRLLDKGADFEARSFWGATPLMLAAASNNLDSVNYLLTKGADVNARSDKGQTALMIASWSPGKTGQTTLGVVKALADFGASVNSEDDLGRSALMGAAEANNLLAAGLLIDRGANVNSKTGHTPLMQAAEMGNVEMIRLLLRAGADPNARDEEGITPLIKAAFLLEKPEAVSALVKGGARIGERSGTQGGTALLLAELVDRQGAADVLKQAGASLSTDEELILAARRGETAKVRDLLGRSANPNATGFRGKSVLIYAIYAEDRNSPAIVRLLIEKGADPNSKDRVGETPLMEASFQGSTEIVRDLLDSGANVNAASNSGDTALLSAVFGARLEVVKLLIARGADVSAQSKSGETILQSAQQDGRTEERAIARVLKDAGANK